MSTTVKIVEDKKELEQIHREASSSECAFEGIQCAAENPFQPFFVNLSNHMESPHLEVVGVYEDDIPKIYAIADLTGCIRWLVMFEANQNSAKLVLEAGQWCKQRYGRAYGRISNQEIRNLFVCPDIKINGELVEWI